MIHAVGQLVGAKEKATVIAASVTTEFGSIKPVKPHTVLYLIWRKPWMAAAKNTFIDEMLQRLGLHNCLGDLSRYPELSPESIQLRSPDLIFLSSEPFPFKEKHIKEISAISPKSRILLVDGEMFSWYGSRLLKAPTYFNSLPLDRV